MLLGHGAGHKQNAGYVLGQPWTGMHTLNPFDMFGDPNRRADNGWGGWVYAVDADSGVWKWRVDLIIRWWRA